MATINFYFRFLLLTIAAISSVSSTCVFDSDFGFKLNCAFRKSSLFRVRNLGGIKAHVGLGFSVGDELGFDQSLSNLDNRRRAISPQNGSPFINTFASLSSPPQTQKTSNKAPVKKNRLTVRQPSTVAVPTTFGPTTTATIENRELQVGRSLNRAHPMVVPPFKPIPPANEMVAPTPTKQSYTMYSNSNQNPNRIGHTANSNLVSFAASPTRVINQGSNTLSSTINVGNVMRTVPAPSMGQYPKFNAMPSSISRISMAALQQQQQQQQQQYNNPGVSVVSSQMYKNTVQVPIAPTMMSKSPSVASFLQNSVSLRKSPVYAPQNSNQKIDNMIAYNTVQNNPSDVYQQKIYAISRATNISVEAIEAAVRLRQNQLISQMINAAQSTSTTTTTTTTTTTPRPITIPQPTNPPKRYYNTPAPQQSPASKVMNAPKEYYPVGYDKNYDDNFVSKVDLPETSFYCGDQKHFPGLYGDEDLGCMVFHVCALTDEGLIMKSFLCPESTLFDQTILKCNWWFYVDCKSSKSLYDSNLPISKSYQLMKALTFFSSYKKDNQGGDQSENDAKSNIEENSEGVNNAVKILQNQSKMQLPKVDEFKLADAVNVPRVEIVEVSKTNRSQVVRGSKLFSPVNANEVNALSLGVVEKENVSEEKEDSTPRNGRNHNNGTTENSVGKVERKETRTEKSTSVERSSIRRRRPNFATKDYDATTPKIVESDDVNKRHRSERASGEITDELESTTKASTVVINEVTSSSINKIIQPTNSYNTDKTIAMMDQAIIGQTKKDFT